MWKTVEVQVNQSAYVDQLTYTVCGYMRTADGAG